MNKLSPLQAIRKQCLFCQSDNAKQVSECHLKECLFYHFRFGRADKISNDKRILSSLKRIKLYCRECSDFNISEQKNCPILDCVLYPFRLGRNPKRAGIGNLTFKGRFMKKSAVS